MPVAFAAAARTPALQAQAEIKTVRRRDHGAGARSRPRVHQDRPALGLCRRRPAMGRRRPAQRLLCLCHRTKAERPIAHLAGFKGILQVVGYTGYPKLAERGDVELAVLGAYAGNFYDLATRGPAPIASEALKRIAEFHAIEKNIRGRSAEERRLIRRQKSRPLAKTFEQGLHAKLALISQKGKLPDAVRYALTRWRGLTRFIDDGCIEIDNIASDQSARSSSTEKCSIRRLRWCRALGRHRLIDRNPQAERRRPAQLSPTSSPGSSMAIQTARSISSCLAYRRQELKAVA